MATKQTTIDYLLEQCAQAGTVAAKKMFGEYAFYCDGKVVALVCDDQLFVKPTRDGQALVREIIDACPYPGAKPYWLVSGDDWDDSDYLVQLIRITADQLPLPKKKSKKKTV